MPLTIPRPSLRRRRVSLRRLLRRPLPWWSVATLLALVTVVTVGRTSATAAGERARWGDTVEVLVASTDHDAGDQLDARLLDVPRALVPDGAATAADEGAVVVTPLVAGEVVVRARLAPAGLSAVAALLPRGTRGIAVPHGVAPLPLEVGDRVDVLATFDPTVVEDPTVTVAEDGIVVAVTEDAVTVAVDEVDARPVAYAVSAAAVTLVLSAV